MVKKLKIFLLVGLVIAAINFSPSKAAANNLNFDFFADTDVCIDFHYNTAKFGNHDMVELGKKKRFRCKICGRVFNLGISVAGHIRGEHHKWLIHKYYEEI
ncbi:MAG: hypothetical protein IJT73_01305 [Selenomonadaceae bacterium]|nr:hypothetical protein [Selenomonadaceae bacterium]